MVGVPENLDCIGLQMWFVQRFTFQTISAVWQPCRKPLSPVSHWSFERFSPRKRSQEEFTSGKNTRRTHAGHFFEHEIEPIALIFVLNSIMLSRVGDIHLVPSGKANKSWPIQARLSPWSKPHPQWAARGCHTKGRCVASTWSSTFYRLLLSAVVSILVCLLTLASRAHEWYLISTHIPERTRLLMQPVKALHICKNGQTPKMLDEARLLRCWLLYFPMSHRYPPAIVENYQECML
jgi:hypothetical protein